MDDLKYQVDLLTALNEKLMKSERVFRQIAESSGNVYLYYDYHDMEINVDFIGPWDDLVGEKISNNPYDESYMLNLLLDEDQDNFREKILYMERDHIEDCTIEVQSKTRKYSFSVNAKAVYNSDGSIKEKLLTFTDISKTKAKNDELMYLAYYDTLTGLYNRNRFISLLREMCEKAEEEKNSVEVLLIDIDDFKKINDTIGLVLGDELVQELAVYLKNYESEDVIIGRYGSDLYVLGIFNPCGQKTADNIYRSIREKLRSPFLLSNRQNINFSVSAGVAEYPDAGRSAVEIIKNAEIVLYKAKEKGNNQIEFFEPNILTAFINDVSVEKQLKAASLNNDFSLYFQPQFNSENGKLRGMEALIRWPNLNGEFIESPDKFIPMAEKNGLIIPMGEWVIKESMRIYSEIRAKYHFPLKLCINISSAQIKKENFVELVQNLLMIYEFNPEMLELDIKEKTFIDDFDDVNEKLSILRKMGVKISLDNFGAGYSSLSFLRKLPIDILKIDKTFVDMITVEESYEFIVKSVIDLSMKFGLETVAKGIESKEQLLKLQKMGCDNIQGFLLGKPMNRTDFEKVIIRQLPN